MAWFNNHYQCCRCDRTWESEWSCMCDDECPFCGERDMTPAYSEDLTVVIEQGRKGFVLLKSPEDAEHDPAYAEVARFDSLDAAAAHLAGLQKEPEHS